MTQALPQRLLLLAHSVHDAITEDEMVHALPPGLRDLDRRVVLMDAVQVPLSGMSNFDFRAARDMQEKQITALLDPALREHAGLGIAYYGFAPIPLAMHLGQHIGDRAFVYVFQRHHQRKDWKWEEGFTPAAAQVRLAPLALPADRSPDTGNVIIRVATSFPISREDTLAVVPKPIHEIDVALVETNPDALRSPADLEAVVQAYQQALRTINEKLPVATAIHVFAAVPTGLAFRLGASFNPTVSPLLQSYQYFRPNRPAYRAALALPRDRPETDPTSTIPGALFDGRYRVMKELGSGGMGTVFEAEDERTQRRVALKVLPSLVLEYEKWRARFETECKAIGKIESEHVVHVLDWGVVQGGDGRKVPYLVMELIRGEDLYSILGRRPVGLPPADVVKYLRDVARGLAAMHTASLVHRDIKPGNLLLTQRDDGTSCVKIIDFGIAKRVEPGGTSGVTEGMMGTMEYLAPEARRDGSIDHRADIYSLGVTGYKLLVGARNGVEASSVSSGFADWYRRATATTPETRFDSAMAAIDALEVALKATETDAPDHSG